MNEPFSNHAIDGFEIRSRPSICRKRGDRSYNVPEQPTMPPSTGMTTPVT